MIADSVAPWGHWVGKILGVPVVTSTSTFAFNRHVMAYAASSGIRPKSLGIILSKIRHVAKAAKLNRALRRRYGVDGPGLIGSVMGSSDLNIVDTSRAFQPCADTFGTTYEFVGPALGGPRETAGFPWNEIEDEAIVDVSLGTLYNTDASFYRTCFEAFGSEDVRVVLSVGSSVTAESLGPAPPNFIVRSQVPQLDVLARATAFVTHGGMNSASESLSHGVPMVVIPQMGEQAIVGHRVAQLGAGLCLQKHQATAERLRSAVRRLRAEEGFRRQATTVRESFAGAGGMPRAADAILAFTRASARR